jgi:hypothetical protein
MAVDFSLLEGPERSLVEVRNERPSFGSLRRCFEVLSVNVVLGTSPVES